jgi:hypothetical protein
MPRGIYERRPYMKSYSPNKDQAIRELLKIGYSRNKIIEFLKVSRSRVAPIAKELKEIKEVDPTNIWGNK